jgi:hypothetical protein
VPVRADLRVAFRAEQTHRARHFRSAAPRTPCALCRLDEARGACENKTDPIPPDIASRPLIDHLREIAQGRDENRTECAETISGSWFAGAARRGEELIAAGVLMLVGHVDLDE